MYFLDDNITEPFKTFEDAMQAYRERENHHRKPLTTLAQTDEARRRAQVYRTHQQLLDERWEQVRRKSPARGITDTDVLTSALRWLNQKNRQFWGGL